MTVSVSATWSGVITQITQTQQVVILLENITFQRKFSKEEILHSVSDRRKVELTSKRTDFLKKRLVFFLAMLLGQL